MGVSIERSNNMRKKCSNVCAVECVNGYCPNIKHESSDNIDCMSCYYNKGCAVCAWYVNGECDISGVDCSKEEGQ